MVVVRGESMWWENQGILSVEIGTITTSKQFPRQKAAASDVINSLLALLGMMMDKSWLTEKQEEVDEEKYDMRKPRKFVSSMRKPWRN